MNNTQGLTEETRILIPLAAYEDTTTNTSGKPPTASELNSQENCHHATQAAIKLGVLLSLIAFLIGGVVALTSEWPALSIPLFMPPILGFTYLLR